MTSGTICSPHTVTQSSVNISVLTTKYYEQVVRWKSKFCFTCKSVANKQKQGTKLSFLIEFLIWNEWETLWLNFEINKFSNVCKCKSFSIHKIQSQLFWLCMTQLLMHSCRLGRKFVANAILHCSDTCHALAQCATLNFHPADIIKLVSFACLHDKLFN